MSNPDNKEAIRCPRCNSIKTGINKNPDRYVCHECGHYFTKKEKIVSDDISVEAVARLDVKLQTKTDRINIKPIGDIHVGSAECDWDKVQATLDYVLNTEGAYMIGMGDYCDCASKMVRKGPNCFESVLTPMQQYMKIYKAFKPLADKGKILGLLTGNHENWIKEDSGMDIIALLSMGLNVPFLGMACDMTIQVNDQKYLCYVQHGSSNAKVSSSKIASAFNSTKDIFAELFLYGHVHQLAVTKGAKRFDGREVKSYYVLTGHFLTFTGSYAQAFGMSICPTGTAKIQMFADRHDIHVSV
jgi:hypothetical protein